MLKITKLETSDKDSASVKVYFDDGENISLSLDTVANFGLYEEKELTTEEFEEIKKYNYSKILKEKALSYINYSPRTEKQVRVYLRKYCKKYGFKDFNLGEIIEEFKDFNYINDRDFAELFVKSRLKNKPRSKYVLVTELLSKGVDKELALEITDEILPEEIEILKALYYKKFGDEPLKYDDRKKIGFLQRKGFSWDSINELIGSFENNDT